MKRFLIVLICIAGFTHTVAQAQQSPEQAEILLKISCVETPVFFESNKKWEEIPMFRGTAYIEAINPNGESTSLNPPFTILANLDTGTYTMILMFGDKWQVVCPLTGGVEFGTVPLP
jgi:hypothetical protein